MKQWTVAYRERNGSKASVVVEAEDRAGVFAELKKRGISAVSVTEGASDKKPRKAASGGAPSKGRGLIAAAMVVLVAGIAAWWMMKGEEKVEKSPVKKQIKTDKKQNKSISNEPRIAKTAQTSGANREAEHELQAKVKSAPQETNNVYIVPSPTNRIFKTGVDQVLSMIFNTELGNMPPPMPRLHQNDVESLPIILAKVNEILDSDDERVKDKKDVVNFAKKELREFIKQGGNHEEFLAHYRGELLRAYRQRRESQRALDRFCDEPNTDAELAREFCRRINEKLSENGIKGVELPDEFKPNTEE